MKIDMCITRREISAKPERKIRKITKLANGDLAVEYGNGTSGTIPACEPQIQAFAVFSVLAEI